MSPDLRPGVLRCSGAIWWEPPHLFHPPLRFSGSSPLSSSPLVGANECPLLWLRLPSPLPAEGGHPIPWGKKAFPEPCLTFGPPPRYSLHFRHQACRSSRPRKKRFAFLCQHRHTVQFWEFRSSVPIMEGIIVLNCGKMHVSVLALGGLTLVCCPDPCAPQTSSSCKTETPEPLSTNFSAPGNHPSTFCLWTLDDFSYPTYVESYLSSCDWLISLSIASPRFICVVARVISFLFRDE